MKASESGPLAALISDSLLATSASASAQLAGRKVAPSRIKGVVSRSGLFTKSHPNFPFTHVEMPLAGPCSGAILRM